MNSAKENVSLCVGGNSGYMNMPKCDICKNLILTVRIVHSVWLKWHYDFLFFDVWSMNLRIGLFSFVPAGIVTFTLQSNRYYKRLGNAPFACENPYIIATN